MTVAFTIDRRWAGFYTRFHGGMLRICCGFFALDYFQESLDLILEKVLRHVDALEGRDPQQASPEATEA